MGTPAALLSSVSLTPFAAVCLGLPMGTFAWGCKMSDQQIKTTKPDILWRLKDLHKQATVERSHFYVGSVIHDAIDEIERMRGALEEIAGLTMLLPMTPPPSHD